MNPTEEYTIQTTAYRSGRIVKDVKVCYPTWWVNRHKLNEVINNMTSLKNN